jgi:hypothetical protein
MVCPLPPLHEEKRGPFSVVSVGLIRFAFREGPERAWEFVLQDESVGFRAVGRVFGWRRDYHLLTYRSLYFKRVACPTSTSRRARVPSPG